MAYTKTNWTDRIVQKPLTFTQVSNGDGTITLVPAEGTITQAGTPITASALNNLETQYDSLSALAQMFKLTQDNGFTTVLPAGTDIRTITTSGFYIGNGLVNMPNNDQSYYRFIIYANSTTSRTLIAVSAQNDMYHATVNGGTWVDWEKHLTDDITWTNLTLTGGTTVFAGRTPRYGKMGNQVVLEGEITAVASNGITMATLPVGFRPPQLRIFKVAHNSSSTNDGATIYVNTDGTVYIQAIASTGYSISLMGISFYTA